jgi:hypothetical protein
VSRIHVYEIPDDCEITLRDGCKTLSEKYGHEIKPRMSMSRESWSKMSGEGDFAFYGQAFEKIYSKHGKEKPKKDIVDVMECPKCGGDLHYRISSYNGHIRGQCETINCLNWMQ